MNSAPSVQAQKVVYAVGVLSITSVVLFIIGAVRNSSLQYWFLLWNLLLAWLPLIFTYFLLGFLKKYKWLSWNGLILTLVWLGLLPNSFYMLSDYIHLSVDSYYRVDLLFDVVMFASFALTGLIIGYICVYGVHQQLRKRLKATNAHLLVCLVLFVSSFAIYIGRVLHWNSWDVILNPAGILFDVSDRLINIRTEPQVISTTLGFFLLFSSLYFAVYEFTQILHSSKIN